jgi:nucleoside-diphosphate-sugar epimerase
MNYLVTGGAGFIGSNLVDRLIKEGHFVTVIDNFAAGKEENIATHKNNPNFKLVRKSICEDLTEMFKEGKFDAVFHFAALPRVQFSLQFPRETHEANINGTFNLLEFCRQFGVKRFIFSSSSTVYAGNKELPLIETMTPKPLCPYGLHKLAGEEYCKLYAIVYGMETVSLRYFNAYGPKQDPKGNYALLVPKFIDMIRQGETPTITGDGNQTRDFTYVDDIVEANILAANTTNKECFGNVFNIGAGNNVSVNYVAEEIIKLSGKEIKPIHGPAVIEARDTLANHDKATKMLGWEPKIVFKEGLKRTWDYLATKDR